MTRGENLEIINYHSKALMIRLAALVPLPGDRYLKILAYGSQPGAKDSVWDKQYIVATRPSKILNTRGSSRYAPHAPCMDECHSSRRTLR
jgi:hypothetical protein